MTTQYEKPIDSGPQACANCPPKPILAPMDMLLMVGFGGCVITKDGEHVYDEQSYDMEKGDPVLGTYELLAQREPDADWRLCFFAPLYEAEYQRQGKEKWVLIRKGLGFA